MTEQQRNQELADTLCREFTWQGQRFREGEYVALLDGKVVAVSESASAAIAALRNIDSNPQRGMVVEIGQPVFDLIRCVR